MKIKLQSKEIHDLFHHRSIALHLAYCFVRLHYF